MKNKTLWEILVLRLPVFCLKPLFDIYFNTLCFEEVNAHLSPSNQPGGKKIYLFWHSKNLYVLPYARNSKACFLTRSDLKHRFLQEIAGIPPSSRVPQAAPGLEALQLFQMLEHGFHLGVPADGPYGPAGRIKHQIFQLAEKAGAEIIPVEIKVSKSFRLPWRWDRFEIAAPFSRITLTAHAPLADTTFVRIEKKISELLGCA